MDHPEFNPDDRPVVSPGTFAVYASHWRDWTRWCEANGAAPLPADPRTLKAYLSERATRHAMSTVNTAAAAVAFHHAWAGCDSPTAHATVKNELANLTRKYGSSGRQVLGMTSIRLAGVSATCRLKRERESEAEAQVRGTVDLAMIGMMRDSLLRRGETAALKWNDLTEEADGSGRLHIARSKTDQEGRGAVTYVSRQTMGWLKKVKESAGDRERIIGLCPHQIARRIVSAAAAADLKGRYGGHSPRIGMTQDLAEDQTGMPNLMQVGRWKRAETLLLYIRNISAGHNAVANWYARRGE